MSGSSEKSSTAMNAARHELNVPDLGLGDRAITVSLWLVEEGSEICEGDRIVELVAGDVTVDLPSPASGILAKTLVDEDEPVAVGQTLARITPRE